MNVWYCRGADSARARHPVHGDVGQVQHQHRARLLRAGRGHPGQDGGPGGRRRRGAHRRRAPPLARAPRTRLLLLTPPPAAPDSAPALRLLPANSRTGAVLARIDMHFYASLYVAVLMRSSLESRQR